MAYCVLVRNLPLLALATGLTLQCAGADSLPNAWQINDNSENSGSILNYITNLSVAQVIFATNAGWRYTVTSRLITDYADTGSMYFIFGDGARRYGLAWDLNGTGQLTASLLGGPAITLVADPVAATNYHVHQLTYEPVIGQVAYEVDGQPVATWGGEVTTAQADTILWGGASSGGRSQMNFHRAEFEIFSQGVIASYNAGLAGNPAVAPSPTNQGWARDTGATAIPEEAVSPDLLPAPLVAVTRAASALGGAAATLNAQIAYNGLPTDYYFEFGTTTNYGIFTGTNTLLADLLSEQVSNSLTALELGTLYHFRIVASNSNGVVTGEDKSFVIGPTFQLVSSAGLPAIYDTSIAWGDYDGDGHLDFLQTGLASTGAVSVLWHNTGSGFADVTSSETPGLPSVYHSSVAWGDYDNDGRLDFLLTGFAPGNIPTSQLWRNLGNGFSNVTASVAPGLPGVAISSVAWEDYDNDGRPDFLLTGTTDGSSFGVISELWRNTGSGFTNATDTAFPPNGLPGVHFSSVAWGDYDNDGRPDFLLTGNAITGRVSELWRNLGTGFSNVTATAAPSLHRINDGSVAWGDFDQDGRLDFLAAGNGKAELWKNSGTGFTNVTDAITPGLPAINNCSATWADYNNDGRPDFLLTGKITDNSSDWVSQLWRNTGTGFVDVTSAAVPGLPGVDGGWTAWGDYDNDGRLDFLQTGNTSTGRVCYLWQNLTIATNTPPTAPTGLAMTASSNAVMLSWNSATDDSTAATGLTYNVRAGTTPGGIDLFAGHVDATNGFRRVPALGNAYLRHSLPLTGLTNGQTVYWSVQAVDTSFAGVPFATETSEVTTPTLAITPSTTTNAIVSWTPPTFGWHLEETPALNPAAWTNSPSGELNPATVSTTNAATLYRLKHE